MFSMLLNRPKASIAYLQLHNLLVFSGEHAK
jgi:hypothetical protein